MSNDTSATVSKVWHDAWVHIEGTQLPNGVEEDVRYDADYLRGVFGG
jgi:hypothetical protein